MRAPMVVGLVKSSGVPWTGSISPVGISVSSTGVYESAASIEFVTENRRRCGPGQVEVAVIGEVDRRGLVGGRLVVDPQLVLVGERVGDGRGEVAGIAFFAVGADVGQLDRRAVAGC